MAGMGKQPCGLSPTGWGTPNLANVPAGGIMADPKTGEALGSRAIDPLTRDYIIGTNSGRIVGQSDTRHLVQMALHTVLNSSAMRGLGLDGASMRRITPDLRRRLNLAIEASVKHIVDAGLIKSLGVTEYRAGRADGFREGRVFARYRWRDLRTQQEYEENV